MKRLAMCGILLGTTLAIGAAAQEPTPRPPAGGQPTGQPTATSTDQRGGQKITVTGCLTSASASTTTPGSPSATPGAPGAPGARPESGAMAAGGYLLTKVGTDTASSTATPGAPSQPAPAGTTGAAGKSYRLVGGESQDLKQFVGQRVEVTGTVSARTAESTPSAPTEPGAASNRDRNVQSLTVTSIKAASGGSCSE